MRSSASFSVPADLPSAFSGESATPSAAHGLAVLLVNLGTPDAPTPRAVRRYLAEFLSDPRVIEIPALFWQPILRLAILPFRGRSSARRYASIWLPQGSPLRIHTEAQADGLREALARRDLPVTVRYAMRYAKPAIGAVLHELEGAGIERVLVLPLYPQYSASTTATAFDAAFDALRSMRVQPALHTVRQYPDDAGYLAALAAQVQDYWETHGRPDFAHGDRLILSFHGVPKRTIELGDPYYSQCQLTGALLRRALGLSQAQCPITFQSRFGREQWLQPYTAPTLAQLGAAGVGRVDVFCPGFVADCLETIEEIGREVRDEFVRAGGRAYHRIPCLNAAPSWIEALARLVETHLRGGPLPVAPRTSEPARSGFALAEPPLSIRPARP